MQSHLATAASTAVDTAVHQVDRESQHHGQRSCWPGFRVRQRRQRAAKSVVRCCDTVLGTHKPYFRDVSDHLARVAEKVEGFDALLTDILTANLAQITILQNEESRQQNDDMRRISAWVALVAADTVLTGIYGMNFDNMPELHTRYGYFVLLAFMLALNVTLYRLFRRSGWL